MRLACQENGYLREWEAQVLRVEGTAVWLDNSLFYPTGGGQPTDTGSLTRKEDGAGYVVLEGKKDLAGVVHVCDKVGLRAGDKVSCALDWERRYRLMRSHTAAHLIGAIINRETGALVTGKQLEPEKSRLDFSLENFDKSLLSRYADLANEAIARDAPLSFSWMARAEALALPGMVKLANKMPPEADELRIVEIEGIDRQACGGTHVRRLSEIGRVVFLKAENKGAENRRLYYAVSP
ncbi:MAG TPA: alanyl-tRNA editing protein [Thermoplasmata archaeon]|nr:alanyl-tRNA editing protein [Thermoplasmata archaeon]